MVKELTLQMEDFLKEFSQHSKLANKFYFTGGTALAYYYLHHRVSVDLDFFSTDKIEPQETLNFVTAWSQNRGAILNTREVGDVQIYEMRFPNDYTLKVDFAHYPYKQIEPTNLFDGIMVDSKKDIAVNKVVAVSQRTDVKDFVDLYYLLKEYSIYNLHELSNIKFRRDYDLMLLASDLTKIKHFDYLPKMLTDLTLDELKIFYLDLWNNVGGHATDF